jgi:hypothetical protein
MPKTESKQHIGARGEDLACGVGAAGHAGAGAELGLYEFQRVGPVHAADFCGRVIAMWLRIRRW